LRFKKQVCPKDKLKNPSFFESNEGYCIYPSNIFLQNWGISLGFYPDSSKAIKLFSYMAHLKDI